MNSLNLRLPSRRTGYIAAALMLVITLVTSAFASAAQVTVRSIELSSSTKSATSVSYKVNFTPVADAEALVVDFCSNTPLIGQVCTAPTGFNADSAGTSTSGFTIDGAETTVNKIVATATTGTIDAGVPVSVTFTGITNPSTSADPLYARIITFVDGTAAGNYDSSTTGVNNPGTNVDDGGVALSITEGIGVSGAVLESMTFCLSGENTEILEEGCTGTLTAPVLKLGEIVGNTVALSANAISTGHVWTQISTNAVGGAIVSLKSNNDCGGLKRFGASGCDIAPALAAGFNTAGQAKFGVMLSTAINAGSGTNSNGTLQPATGSAYDASSYKLNFPSGNGSGVSSTYGDPLLDTADGPINNKVMDLTFGASIANNTPAGNYTADLSLIATGKF